MKKRCAEAITALLLLAGAFAMTRQGYLSVEQKLKEKKTVVIDAGHGGEDSGKVGLDGVLEKDLNLEIAIRVRDMLEAEGIAVVMTRETDTGLYEEGSKNHKVQDMQKRCSVIEKAKPVCTVSIHQNSYTDSSCRGPQIFYYRDSAEGEKLAGILQDTMNKDLDITRPRSIQSNTSYYLLKRSVAVTVIVECGFITNPNESALLQTDEYRQKVAESICHGIEEYVIINKAV